MRLLSQKGFESVMSIEGGFSEWVKLQLPISEKIHEKYLNVYKFLLSLLS